MAGILESMFQVSAEMAEKGLLMMDSALRGMQSAVVRMSGVESGKLSAEIPVDGPKSLDEATSEMWDRLFRLWWSLRGSRQDFLTVWNDVLQATRRSFGGINISDPRRLMTLPIQMPLSLGSLMTQQSLRGIYAARSVGPENLVDFASYVTDNLTDVHIFISLQYKDLLKRFEDRVREHPDDSETRLKLARTLLKMGLYPEAAQEFRTVAETSRLRAEALSDSTVANFRAGRYRDAIADGVGSLSADGASKRTRYWLWLAAQRAGGYTDDVPGEFRVEVKAGRSKPKVKFEDVASKIGLDKTAGCRGTAVFDMNGDGYLDIVVACAHGGCSVYRNNGDGTFTDVSVGSGLDECVNTFAVVAGDYNNDGFDDLYITRLGFFPGDSVLYRNNGDGTFTDVTRESGAGCWGASFSAQWVDYNCDGNLDLFVCSNLGGLFERATPNRLFHNNGDGTFTDVSRDVGIETISPTIGACWGDYNNDGYPDLFVSSAMGRSKLFRNNGNGTFTDVSRDAGFDNISIGTVAFWCDVDNDGWLDLVQYTWSPEDQVLDTLFNGEGPADGQPMRVYRNNRDGTFTLVSRDLGLTGCFGTMSGSFGDFNNDGYMDFLLGNGDPHMNRTEPAVILEYDGKEGKYRNVTFAAGLPYTGKGHGANLADLAGDGRLCLIVASGGAYPADLLTMSVFRPKSLPGNYLNVRLVGTKSNRNAVGARVRLDAQDFSRHQLVSCGTGFGCVPYEQHFGLGKNDRVDGLEIWWPSGLKQQIKSPPVNSTIRIIEGKSGWEPVYDSKQLPAQQRTRP